MKKINLLMLLAVLLLPMSLLLADSRQDTGSTLLIALGPLIVAIASPLLIRLFKKLGIDLQQDVLEPILMRIIEIIASVEKDNPTLMGNDKKIKVVSLARTLLGKAEQKLLIKRYGSMETAVQAAFERSSVAGK